MTNHTKWVLRFRLTTFFGMGLALGSGSVGGAFLQDGVQQVLVILGLCVALVGVLDSMELIQRKWVKAAIREERERVRARRLA